MRATSPEVVDKKKKKNPSPEEVANRAQKWSEIEPIVKRKCQKKWYGNWEDFLSDGKTIFLESHDVEKNSSIGLMVWSANKKCDMGAREEARQNGVPQREYKKSKPDYYEGQNNDGEQVSKSKFVAPKHISIDVLGESGIEIGDKDPTERIEQIIYLKSLIKSGLELLKDGEAEKYIGAINLVFQGFDLAEAARKNGLNPVYLSRWLAQIGYANGRPLPATSTKRAVTQKVVVQPVTIAAEVIATAVVTPQPPQLPIAHQLPILPVITPEPFLGITEYVQSQMELFAVDVIQLVEKTKPRARRKTSPKQIVLTSNIDQLAFNFDNIDSAVSTPSLEADASATETIEMYATQEPELDAHVHKEAVKRQPYAVYGYNTYAAINLARFNHKHRKAEYNQIQNPNPKPNIHFGTHHNNYQIHHNPVINKPCCALSMSGKQIYEMRSNQ